MNSKTIQYLQSYIGAVCSIVTTAMNRSFNEVVAREHFVVRISMVTADGVWGTHPYNPHLDSFFAMPHIISIHRETELDKTNPEHAQMIEEFEQKTGKKVESDLKPKPTKTIGLLPVIQKPIETPTSEEADVGDATFVDIANLERLAENSKRSFDVQDQLAASNSYRTKT